MESIVPFLIFSAHSELSEVQREVCRNTWGPLLRPEFRPFFVVGAPALGGEEWKVEGDILRVRCPDIGDTMDEKLALALRAVVSLFQFPWLFRLTDSAWLNPWQLNGYPFWRWDQVGVFSNEGDWVDSGCGYTLSYRAVRHVVDHWGEAPATARGDARIGHLLPPMHGATRLHEPLLLPQDEEAGAVNELPFHMGPKVGADAVAELIAFHESALLLARRPGRRHSGYALKATFATPPATSYLQLRPVTPKEGFPWDGRIFIQIAAYREKDLLNTLRSLVTQASKPERLRFGICWQRAEEDSLEEFMMDPRVRLHDVPWQEAKGLGWARHMTQQLYNGEEFTMQIDAHERFIQGWDEALIRMLAQTDSSKPFLSVYPAYFVPGKELLRPGRTWIIVSDGFCEDGTLSFRCKDIPNPERLSHPVPARFIAGGFFFTYGSHCTEVPYDPHIYYSDELTMAIRTFTHGYDLYHPHLHIAWHHYGREEESRHWSDHTPASHKAGEAQSVGWLRHLRGNMQIQQLLGQQDWGIRDFGVFGFGRERTLADYERYAGLDLRRRKIHEDIAKAQPPPTPYYGDEVWELALKQISKCR